MTGNNKFPGRDRRAHHIPARPGMPQVAVPRTVTVVGGGIAGLAAATGLSERGVKVQIVEPELELGGRVRAWTIANAAGEVTMSRGFHAFFRQYYNLRNLLSRGGPLGERLVPLSDYPVVNVNGDRDGFAKIPRTPPWNFASFVARSPTFTARDLTRVNLDAALALLDVDFPETFRALDGVSAAQFLDRLRFPSRARHLALEVFARSFFADPREFAAGELVAMFHAYFLGSSEGLLFDVPRDDFDTSLWQPLWHTLQTCGVSRRTASAQHIERGQDGTGWVTVLDDGTHLDSDAVVLAAGPRATPELVAASPDLGSKKWRERVTQGRLAPEFAVLRLWTDKPVLTERPAFLGTAGFGPLDNISVLERFEQGAHTWAQQSGGSVIELHAYAIPEGTDLALLRGQLREELGRVYPETRGMQVLAEEYLVEHDCPLVDLDSWEHRPEVPTPESTVMLAGDWVRCDLPVALMERAATTGWTAANKLLELWGTQGHDLWSVPTAARHAWPGWARDLIRKRAQRSQ